MTTFRNTNRYIPTHTHRQIFKVPSFLFYLFYLLSLNRFEEAIPSFLFLLHCEKYVYSNHDTVPTIWTAMFYFFLKENLCSNIYQLCKQLEGRAWRRGLTWWWGWRWRRERRKSNFRFLDKNEIAEEEVASDNTNTH